MSEQVEAADALAAIARSVAGSADLGDVFNSVVATTRPLLPFDRMGVCWTEGASALQFRDLSAGIDTRPVARSDLSPRLWPTTSFEAELLSDAAQLLDGAFRIDREIAEAGVRSLLRAPLSRAPDE